QDDVFGSPCRAYRPTRPRDERSGKRANGRRCSPVDWDFLQSALVRERNPFSVERQKWNVGVGGAGDRPHLAAVQWPHEELVLTAIRRSELKDQRPTIVRKQQWRPAWERYDRRGAERQT